MKSQCRMPGCTQPVAPNGEFDDLCEYHDELAASDLAEEDYAYRKSVN